MIYIGDETRDIEAAHDAKIKIIAVTWGLNSRQILTKYKPEWLVNAPDDVITVLTGEKNS